MNLFQFITVPLVAVLFVRSIFNLVRGRQPRGTALLGAAIWLSAGVAILHPGLTIRIANFLGISRGADLLLYFLAILFFVACFYFYNRNLKLESYISEIVRQLAIRDAMARGPQGHPETNTQAEQTDDEWPRDKGPST